MALKSLKSNHLTPLGLKGLSPLTFFLIDKLNKVSF